MKTKRLAPEVCICRQGDLEVEITHHIAIGWIGRANWHENLCSAPVATLRHAKRIARTMITQAQQEYQPAIDAALHAADLDD